MEKRKIKRLFTDFSIVALNLIVFVFYTGAIFYLKVGLEAGITDLIVLLIHVSICFIITGFFEKKIWLLTGLLILIIGFSVCANGDSIIKHLPNYKKL